MYLYPLTPGLMYGPLGLTGVFVADEAVVVVAVLVSDEAVVLVVALVSGEAVMLVVVLVSDEAAVVVVVVGSAGVSGGMVELVVHMDR